MVELQITSHTSVAPNNKSPFNSMPSGKYNLLFCELFPQFWIEKRGNLFGVHFQHDKGLQTPNHDLQMIVL